LSELDIFLEALKQPDQSTRAVYLDQACGAGSALRQRIEELLEFHASDHSLLDRRPVDLLVALGPDAEQSLAAADSQVSDVTATLLRLLAPATRPDSLGRLGHYDVLQVLGDGGFGIVFKAFDDTLQRCVAIKILLPHLAATSPPRKRFLREARAAAAVRHENVVHIYAIQEVPFPYLVMEFIEGQTLQQRLDAEGPFEAAEVIRLGQQIALGLAAAHDKGLIHRDVKPANVLLEAGAEPRVKLTDFGLARTSDDASMTHSGTIAGSPLYMAPEQAGGAILDHRADQFSLGSVLYTMVTGRPPFRAPTTLAVLKRVADDTPRPIREVMAHVPESLCRVINRLLSKKPADRFSSTREVVAALAGCLSDSVTPTVQKRGSFFNAKYVRPAGIALGIFLLIVGMVWAWRPKQELLAVQNLSGTVAESGTESLPKEPDKLAPQLPAPVLSKSAKVIENSLNMKLVFVPPGRFWMGSPTHEAGRSADETQHEVEITQGFYIGAYEITQAEYLAVMGSNPSTFCATGGGKDRVQNMDTSRFPVESISWHGFQMFVDKLNELDQNYKPGWKYRMPSEAEWEYACRGGPAADGRPENELAENGHSKNGSMVKAFHYGDTLTVQQANFAGAATFGQIPLTPSLQRTCPVGMFHPNALGLYDMHGNVSEWCADWYDKDAYGKDLSHDPAGPTPSTDRVIRGGSYGEYGRDCRSASRSHFAPFAWGGSLGFRVVLAQQEK
jgi:serine/threonine protein kinase